MSKQLTALLLQKSISGKSRDEQKEYLLQCLKKQGIITDPISFTPPDDTPVDICELCSSSDIIYSSDTSIKAKLKCASHCPTWRYAKIKLLPTIKANENR